MIMDLFERPKVADDVRRDYNHWKGIADTMASSYPDRQYGIVEDMFGSFVCVPVSEKFSNRNFIYKTGGGYEN